MTLKWIEAQIEAAKDWDNDRDSIRDLAALLLVRDHLRASDNPERESHKESAEDRRRREAIVLTQHSADLNVRPRIEEIEDALGSIVVNTAEERQRHKDARTWADIIEKHKK